MGGIFIQKELFWQILGILISKYKKQMKQTFWIYDHLEAGNDKIYRYLHLGYLNCVP